MKLVNLFLFALAIAVLHGCTPVSEEHYSSGNIKARVELNPQGVAHGKGTYYYESGRVKSEGEFVNALKRGPWKWYYDSTGTSYMTGSFTDGLESGIFTEFYRDGSVHQIATLSEGKMDGVTQVFHPDGRKESVITYRAGLQHDTSWFYHPNGILSMLSIARNDTIYRYTAYDSLGERRKEFILFPDSADVAGSDSRLGPR